MAEKLFVRTTELKKEHSTAATEAVAGTEEKDFKEEGGGLGRNDPNKHQV